MDRNELREQLRKKTARPAQPDKVKELWKNIETEAELNTRQKLEKLLALSRKKEPEKRLAPARILTGRHPAQPVSPI